MEFWHLSRLIDLIIVPFVKHCPLKLREEWMVKFFVPLLNYCEDMLGYSWLNLLYNGQLMFHVALVTFVNLKKQ
jgi:exportin-5